MQNLIILAAEEGGHARRTRSCSAPDRDRPVARRLRALLFLAVKKYVVPSFEKTFAERTRRSRAASARPRPSRPRPTPSSPSSRSSSATPGTRRPGSARRLASRAPRSSPRCASRRRPSPTRIVEHGKTADRGRAPAGGHLAACRGRRAWRPTLAGRIVGESLDDEARQSRVVERFLADLETPTASTSTGSGVN